MGEETCRDCRSREEELYWTHFQYTQFIQILHVGFDQHLAIPEKFTRNLKKKLPDIVTLTSPSGIKWKVELMAINDSWFFSHGWGEFVKDHFLKENDFLIFKFDGQSHFYVSMFDGLGMCEKAVSYFVKKCGHQCDNVCQKKRKSGESSVEAASLADVEGSRPEISETALRQAIFSRVVNKKTWGEINWAKPHGIPTRATVRNNDLCSVKETEVKPDIQHMPFTDKAMDEVQYTSRPSRRPATEEEKKNALQLSQAAVTELGFLLVMKPSHVGGRFHMSIPRLWITKHISFLKNHEVILRCKEKFWQTRFYYRNNCNRGGLDSGWKDFVVGNNLCEHDVCVFEPSTMVENLILLDVQIFPAVPEASPQTSTARSR